MPDAKGKPALMHWRVLASFCGALSMVFFLWTLLFLSVGAYGLTCLILTGDSPFSFPAVAIGFLGAFTLPTWLGCLFLGARRCALGTAPDEKEEEPLPEPSAGDSARDESILDNSPAVTEE